MSRIIIITPPPPPPPPGFSRGTSLSISEHLRKAADQLDAEIAGQKFDGGYQFHIARKYAGHGQDDGA